MVCVALFEHCVDLDFQISKHFPVVQRIGLYCLAVHVLVLSYVIQMSAKAHGYLLLKLFLSEHVDCCFSK